MDHLHNADAEAGLDPRAGAGSAAAQGFSATTAANRSLISGVDCRSPILLQHQYPQDQTNPQRHTSYASIPLPDDSSSVSSSHAHSPPSYPAPVPTSRPKWTRPILRATSATWRILKGPIPPIKTYIKPLFPHYQSAPSRLLSRLLPKPRHRRLLQLAFWALWLTIFCIITHWSRFRTSVGGVHATSDGGGVRQLTCTSALWARNNGCGLNGDACKPFAAAAATPFRCPSGCISSGKLMNPRQVGNQTLVYQQMVVGGPAPEVPEGVVAYDATYRADSTVCAAAIHAGVISDLFGGCGLLLQTGATTGLVSSKRHGITSAAFDASFPSTFTFFRPPPGTELEGCLDLRWHLLPITSMFTFLQALLSTQAATFFGTVFVAIFWHVGLMSDPPPAQYNRNDQFEVVSIVAGRFLPAAFVMYIFYLHVLGPTWAGNTSPSWPREVNRPRSPFRLPPQLAVERAVYVLFGWWFGALNNVTFAKIIPLQRLTPHDLANQPGAKPALGIVIVCLVFITFGQMHFLRREGRLPKYLGIYAALGTGLLVFTFALQEMSVRIHHYILALLLLPGTKVGSRPSLVYQGLLLGLFVNGAARWGFASLLETRGVLLGDAVYGVGRVPVMVSPSGGESWEWSGAGRGTEVNSTTNQFLEIGNGEESVWLQNVTLHWRWPTLDENRLYDSKTGLPIEGATEFDGISVLINDVERHQAPIPGIFSPGSATQASGVNATTSFGGNETIGTFSWTRMSLPKEKWAAGEAAWEKLYVRMAFTTKRNGRGVGDYTRAGVVGEKWPGGQGREGWAPPGGGRT
ncbi:hypothetical protein EV426DRAFT_674523 [Tirmania nivea]|nr:hypothetical protein EV426DRAFT_674523 [Tirmania nivea]